MKVRVVVASATGRTRRMAEALVEGAAEAGADATLCSVEQAGEAELLEADALVLGCGVHMGGLPSAMTAFFERTAGLWMRGALIGRLGAAFVSAGEGEGGGAELALLALHAYLAENGLLIVPMHNRLDGFRGSGSHWGPLARSNPGPDAGPGPAERDLAACRAHGRFVAECTARWLAGQAGPHTSARSGPKASEDP